MSVVDRNSRISKPVYARDVRAGNKVWDYGHHQWQFITQVERVEDAGKMIKQEVGMLARWERQPSDMITFFYADGDKEIIKADDVVLVEFRHKDGEEPWRS
jgi:hypothetical protein